MELTVLGSGSSVPHAKRCSSAYWLGIGGAAVLLDCSAAAVSRMPAEGLDWSSLDAIWISHFHLDHCAGLAPLLFGTKHAPDTRRRKKPLMIFGPVGLRDLILRFSDANTYGLLEQPFPIEVVEVEPLEKFEILPGVEATTLKTPHTPESLAIHIRGGGRTLVYTSDTGYAEAMSAFARRVDLLLMECSFYQNKPTAKHLVLAEAIMLVRKTQPKRTLLTHFYPEWDAIDLNAEVRRLSP
ncbi:MAG: MBL fold metallo-hydrolase, partial [Acidobacteriota bacterium]